MAYDEEFLFRITICKRPDQGCQQKRRHKNGGTEEGELRDGPGLLQNHDAKAETGELGSKQGEQLSAQDRQKASREA